MLTFPGLLTLTVFLPALGALAILLAVRGDRVVRGFALLVGLADLAAFRRRVPFLRPFRWRGQVPVGGPHHLDFGGDL